MNENDNTDEFFPDDFYTDNQEGYEALLSEIDKELMEDFGEGTESVINNVTDDTPVVLPDTEAEKSVEIESSEESDSLIDAFLSEQNGEMVFEENVPFEMDDENLVMGAVESEAGDTVNQSFDDEINSDYVNKLVEDPLLEIESEMLESEQTHENESQQTETIHLDEQGEDALVDESGQPFEGEQNNDADNSEGIEPEELVVEAQQSPFTPDETDTTAQAIEFDLDLESETVEIDTDENSNESDDANRDATVQLTTEDEVSEEVEEVEDEEDEEDAEEINEPDSELSEENTHAEGLEFDLDGFDLDETQPETNSATTQATIDPHTYNRQQVEYGAQTPTPRFTQAVDMAQPQAQKATAFGPAQSAPVASQQGPGLLSSLGNFFMSHVKHGAATINSKLLQSTVNAQDQQLKANGAVLDKVVDTFLTKQEGHLSNIEQNSENLTDNLKTTMNKDFQEFLDMGFEGSELSKTQRERFENIGNRASSLSNQDDLLNDDLKERLSELAEKVKELIKSLFKKSDEQSLAQS
ncbi:MAG: hypothetical protein JXQ95_07165 [Alteromonas stellipolaris]|uniref:hypothetical protein n=1 Tax=Alteromonas stellipolaris TaxID=233316 RepID=UPI003B8B4037